MLTCTGASTEYPYDHEFRLYANMLLSLNIHLNPYLVACNLTDCMLTLYFDMR